MSVLVQYLNIHTRKWLFINKSNSKRGPNNNKKAKKKNVYVVQTPINVRFCHIFLQNTSSTNNNMLRYKRLK